MEEKRKFKVVVRNSANKIEAMHTFDNFDTSLVCFVEFIRNRYSYYHKISIEAIKVD